MVKQTSGGRLGSIIGCLVVMFGIGIEYLWSVFQQPVIDHYGWAPASVSMIASIMIFMFIFGSMIGGFLQDKASPRFSILLGGVLMFVGLFATSLLGPRYPWMVYITYGVVAGFGVGLAYAGSLNCVQKWFPHRRGFASGITVCAFGLSTVAFAPLIQWLLKLPAFGDNAVPLTFRWLAVIFFVIVVAAGIFVKNPTQAYIESLNIPAKYTTGKQYKPKEVLKTAPFWLLSVVIFFLPAVYMIIIPIIETLGKTRGIADAQGALTVSMMGVVSAVARLGSGYISDRIGRSKTVFILGVLAMAGALLMTFAHGWFYTIVVWIIVFSYAGPSSIYPAMSTDTFGTKHSGGNYGMALMFLGICSPVFTILANSLNRDGPVTGNYTASFVVAACGCVLPLIALPLFDKYRKRLKNNDTQNSGAFEKQ